MRQLLVAAFLVALGRAGPGSAAPVTYDLVLAFESEAFEMADIWRAEEEGKKYLHRGWLEGSDNEWGLRGAYSDLAPGDLLTFSFVAGDTISSGWDCRIDVFRCYDPPSVFLGTTVGSFGDFYVGTVYGSSGLRNGYWFTDISVEGNVVPGSSVVLRFLDMGYTGPPEDLYDGNLFKFYRDYLVTLSLVSATCDGRRIASAVQHAVRCLGETPPPVPAPAGLPLWIAALLAVGVVRRASGVGVRD